MTINDNVMIVLDHMFFHCPKAYHSFIGCVSMFLRIVPPFGDTP